MVLLMMIQYNFFLQQYDKLLKLILLLFWNLPDYQMLTCFQYMIPLSHKTQEASA